MSQFVVWGRGVVEDTWLCELLSRLRCECYTRAMVLLFIP